MAMKMRQSLASSSRIFGTETQLDRSRRETLRRHAVRRSRARSHERQKKRGSVSLLGADPLADRDRVIVTAAMFETLYLLLG